MQFFNKTQLNYYFDLINIFRNILFLYFNNFIKS